MFDDLIIDRRGRPSIASRTASPGSRSWRPNTADRRRLRVLKYRETLPRRFSTTSSSRRAACACSRGWWRQNTGGFHRTTTKTKSKALECVLGGGVERGSSVLVLGPAGAGKSIIVLTFVHQRRPARGARGPVRVRRGAGTPDTAREGLGIDLQAMRRTGKLHIISQVDAAELTPGEFSARVRDCLET